MSRHNPSFNPSVRGTPCVAPQAAQHSCDVAAKLERSATAVRLSQCSRLAIPCAVARRCMTGWRAKHQAVITMPYRAISIATCWRRIVKQRAARRPVGAPAGGRIKPGIQHCAGSAIPQLSYRAAVYRVHRLHAVGQCSQRQPDHRFFRAAELYCQRRLAP